MLNDGHVIFANLTQRNTTYLYTSDDNKVNTPFMTSMMEMWLQMVKQPKAQFGPSAAQAHQGGQPQTRQRLNCPVQASSQPSPHKLGTACVLARYSAPGVL